MAETETPAEGTETPETETQTEQETQSGPVTKADLEALRAEISRMGQQAYGASRRAESKAEVAQRIALEKTANLEARYEELALRDLPDHEKQAFRNAREIERLKAAPPDAQVQQQQAQQEFAAWSNQTLSAEGFDTNQLPQELVEAYNKRVASAQSPADWRAALGLAVSDYRKVEVEQARKEATEREKRAREDERTKAQNGARKTEPRIDRGQPSAASGKSPSDMTPEEFNAFLVAKGGRPLGTR